MARSSQTSPLKIALITGSSRGIGRKIAQRLAADGMFAIVHYASNSTMAEEAVAEIEAAGGQAMAMDGDIRSPDGIQAMFARIDEALQARFDEARIDVFVNCVGITDGGPIHTIDETTYDRLFDTNVKGAFFAAQHALARMPDGGRMVFISSISAIRAMPTRPLYSASKAAINGLVISLAQFLGPRNITVNAVMPGTTMTEMAEKAFQKPGVEERVRAMIAMDRVGQPEEVADAVAALVSHDGRWITGQCIAASGGQQL